MARREMEIQIAGRYRIIGIEAAGQFAFVAIQLVLLVLLAELNRPAANDSEQWQRLLALTADEHWVQWIFLVPLLGALAADVVLGKRLCLVISCVLCVLGLGLMSLSGQFPQPILVMVIGLGLVALGIAGIKPCTLALIGDQAAHGGERLLSRAFHQVYFFAQIALCASMWVTPNIIEQHGPQWSLALPCLLLCIALACFLLGWRRMRSQSDAHSGFLRELFTLNSIGKWLKCVPVLVCLACFWAFASHIESSWIRQAQLTNLEWIGSGGSSTQLEVIKPLLVVCFIPLLGLGIFPLWKMAGGMVLLIGAFASMAIIARSLDADQLPSPWIQWLAVAMVAAAEVMVVISALVWLYRVAPASMKSCAMALAIASIWAGDEILSNIQRATTVPSAASQQWSAAHAALPLEWQKSPRSVVLPGFSNDPQDDIIARGKSGVIHQLEIPGDEVYQRAANRIDDASGDGFPSNKIGQKMINELRDLWGNPLIYQRVHRDHAKIFSAGPDRQIGTQWDLGIAMNRKQQLYAGGDGQRDFAITYQPISGGGKRFTAAKEDGLMLSILGAVTVLFFAYALVISAQRPKAE